VYRIPLRSISLPGLETMNAGVDSMLSFIDLE
jgi:hypothetical protein